MDEAVRNYMAEIGRRGGKKSRRTLSSEEARELQRRREEKRREKVAEQPAPKPKHELSPRCLKCESFDRDALECTAADCPHAK